MSQGQQFDGYNITFFKHLDTPPMLFIFESDEFIIGIVVYLSTMASATAMGIVLPGGVLAYALLGIGSMFGYIKYKKTKPNGFLVNRLYRIGILNARTFNYKRKLTKQEKSFKVLPYGFLKEFSGN